MELPPIRPLKTQEIRQWARDCDAIVFDLGKVLLDIDYQPSIDAFGDLSANLNELDLNLPFFYDFETGALDAFGFREQLRAHIRWAVNDSQLDHAWNALIKDMQPNWRQTLRRLGKDYRLGLLSNTNPIHIKDISKRLGKFEWAQFLRCFDAVGLSHHMGMRKPDLNIYASMDAKLSISDPSRVLFLDDNLDNCEAAASHCWKAIHFIPQQAE